MRAVHIGPGNIGRGLIGRLLYESGYQITFIGVTDTRIALLNRERSYNITHLSEGGAYTTNVKGFDAISMLEDRARAIQRISTADILTCAVGGGNLTHIASLIAGGLMARGPAVRPLIVIACENTVGASDIIAQNIIELQGENDCVDSIGARAIYANSMIDCIVPTQAPHSGLDIEAEAYHEWVVDATALGKHSIPAIKGVTWVTDLTPYVERKLFSINTAHAAATYFGYQRGHLTIQQAMMDPEILRRVTRTLRETGSLLIQKHGFDIKGQENYIATTISRISNCQLTDLITRVGRSPIRKLGRFERLISPIVQLHALGLPVDALVATVEQAFRYQAVSEDDDSIRLAQLMQSKQSSEIASEACGLCPGSDVHGVIASAIARAQHRAI